VGKSIKNGDKYVSEEWNKSAFKKVVVELPVSKGNLSHLLGPSLTRTWYFCNIDQAI